ncbi:nitrite reductase (NAD(P)H) small subunit [Streptomyces collinus]|uniref:nitrite reductase (NAD(P)H) small subunit n=1 Tax=Streptomyces collinus TaxID=42684 RepID=UPI003323B4A7
MTLAPETTGLLVHLRLADGWFTVCELHRLVPGRGIAALLPDDRPVAVFRDCADRLYTIDNRDPFGGAAALSRGLTIGTHRAARSRPPRCRSGFDLETGQCLDDESVRVTTYRVRGA